MKGAFAGYFLLVIIGVSLQYSVMNNKDSKTIENLTREIKQKDAEIKNLNAQLNASANPVIDWRIDGLVKPTVDGTRFFYDDGTTRVNPDGSFALIKRCIAAEGKAEAPKWMCIYNRSTGFKVVSFNRDLNSPDIATYDIHFDDNTHKIKIGKPVEINSHEKDSILSVANFIEKTPGLKTQVMNIEPDLLRKASIIRKQTNDERSKRLKFEKNRLKP